jgi:hypothetical protein
MCADDGDGDRSIGAPGQATHRRTGLRRRLVPRPPSTTSRRLRRGGRRPRRRRTTLAGAAIAEPSLPFRDPTALRARRRRLRQLDDRDEREDTTERRDLYEPARQVTWNL